MSNANTVIAYAGPSLITGKPTVMLVTGLEGSANRKTGSMIQTYILCGDVAPLEAVRTGADAAVCGGCPQRRQVDAAGVATRGCYVNVGQAPTALYGAYRGGRYRMASPAELASIGSGRLIRMGSYGDPAAVPESVWRALLALAGGWTGYTHQWRRKRFAWLKDVCQASVEDQAGAARAAREGWGYFRVVAPGTVPAYGGETLCPASLEAGKVSDCARCQMCGGTTGARGVRRVVIHGHGNGGKYAAA